MAEMNLSILVFFSTIYLTTLKIIQNSKTLAVIGAEKSITENLIGDKEKMTNKGNDKQEEVDSPLHNATSRSQHGTKF